MKDSPELWKGYRAYGAGQAKLSFLKPDASSQKPTSVDTETLSNLANEDAWQEFVPIDLGHWDKSDLRKISEEAGVKDVYDNFYGWTSTYSHGQWCAVRDVVFDTCGNVLHRLHRIPRSDARSLPLAIRDGATWSTKYWSLFPRRIQNLRGVRYRREVTAVLSENQAVGTLDPQKTPGRMAHWTRYAKFS